MMGWVEQKLISITTSIYMKRREPEPTIAPLGYEPVPKTRKATKPSSKVTKAKVTLKSKARGKRTKV